MCGQVAVGEYLDVPSTELYSFRSGAARCSTVSASPSPQRHEATAASAPPEGEAGFVSTVSAAPAAAAAAATSEVGPAGEHCMPDCLARIDPFCQRGIELGRLRS